MQRKIARCLSMTVFMGVIGVFLTIRLKGFLLQAYSYELPSWSLYGLILLIAFLGGFFAKQVWLFLNCWAKVPSICAAFVYVVSVLVSFLLSRILLDRALENSGVIMSQISQYVFLLGAGLLLGTFLLCLSTALQELSVLIVRKIKKINRYDVIFLLSVLVIINIAVRIYAVNSSTIYCWDNAGYWKTANSMVEQWKTDGIMAVLCSTYDSILKEDYNWLIALPSMVFARILGEGRYAFLASIANFGYYPICILVWFAAKYVGKRPILTSAAVLMMVPMLFVNVLKGFVDVAGCAATLAAMFLWLYKRRENDFGQFLLIGVCLAVALLLRRWYSFFALSFMLTLVIDCLVFRRSGVPLLGALAGFAFTLLFFFQPLVSGKLLADYGTMYAAYSQEMRKNFLLLFYYYGWIPLAISLAVDVYCVIKKETCQIGLFVLIQTLLCFVLFVKIQTHGQQHLLLYVPMQITMSMILIVRLLNLRRECAVAGTLVLSLIPTLMPFFPSYQPASVEEIRGMEPWPSYSWYPPQREDAEDMVALMRRLDGYGAEGKTVGLLASSFVLNWDILMNAEASLSLPRVSDVDRNAYFLSLPQVDQRDGWSDTIFACDVLVVTDPIQLHLGEENQAVVWLPAEKLLNGEGFAAAYERSDEVWELTDGITLYFFEKTRELTEAEMEELRQMFYQITS